MFWVVGCAGAPPVSERTQHRSTPNRHKKERKKKSKAIGEAVADRLEQDHVQMEKKLKKHSTHQYEKLRFLREQSNKQLAFEHRRLDLKFMQMD